jgi:hypothetical protein
LKALPAFKYNKKAFLVGDKHKIKVSTQLTGFTNQNQKRHSKDTKKS